MTVRNPLAYNVSDYLQEQSAASKTAISQRAVYQFGLGTPKINLSGVVSGGNLGTIYDYRYRTGYGATNPTAYVNPGSIFGTSVAYSKISSTTTFTSAPIDTNLVRFPAYWNGSGVQSMNLTDFFDTYIDTAIGYLADGNATDGTWQIHANAVNPTNFSNGFWAYTDTYFGNRSGSILVGVSLDAPLTVNNFYANRANAGARFGVPSNFDYPAYITTAGDLKTYSAAEFDTLLLDTINFYTTNIAGHRISYNINGAGLNKGSTMTDTRRAGTQLRQDIFYGVDDYRTRYYPNGSLVTVGAYYLRIERI